MLRNYLCFRGNYSDKLRKDRHKIILETADNVLVQKIDKTHLTPSNASNNSKQKWPTISICLCFAKGSVQLVSIKNENNSEK